MIWSGLFLTCILLGTFLIALFVSRSSSNRAAASALALLILVIVLNNLGYLIIRTDLVHYVPQLYGFTFGSIFLYGPLFLLYVKAITHPSYRWKPVELLHFVPYLIFIGLMSQFLLQPADEWQEFVSAFLSGQLPIRPDQKIWFGLELVHCAGYLVVAFRLLRQSVASNSGVLFLVPLATRVTWLRRLGFALAALLLVIFGLFIFVLSSGFYNPITNYLYALSTAAIIFSITYGLIIHPDLLNPGFDQKYRSYKTFSGPDGQLYLDRLGVVLTEQKVYLRPELTLAMLSAEIGLPSHQLSKLINEKFGRSFVDLINEYRVREFLDRMNDKKYQHFTIYGIALEVGFNSKSAFHTAFKKQTGKNPSELRSVSPPAPD